MKNITLIVFSIIFTLLGLAGGYFAAAQKSGGGGGEAPPEGDAHAHEAAKPKLSPQTLKNLGVSVAPAETTNFVRKRAVPATVIEAPLSTIPVLAPVGGRVQKVHVLPGAMASTGAVLVQILRDPLPRPTYSLTEEVLKFTNEDLHRTASELRKAASNVALIKTELARIEKLAGNGGETLVLLPKKNVIDLQYDLSRAENELNNAKLELKQHGYSAEQIAAYEAGREVSASGQRAWKQAFERNGLWSDSAEALYQALPEKARALPWNIAAIGELAASGLTGAELAEWVKKHPEISAYFQNVSALLQQGHSLVEIEALRERSAFEPIVTVVAPAASGKAEDDWDVREVLVRSGEHVEAGAKLLTLDNPRLMLLKVVPSGGDTAVLLAAHEKDIALDALPLMEGAGPTLQELKLVKVEGDEQVGGVTALAALRNEPLGAREMGSMGKVRSWRLRKGMKYMLQLPVQEFKNIYLLPNDAVTDDGPDKVIFIEDGNSFKPLKVEIAYIDHAVAIIANNKDTEIFPGDNVVQHGAFGLSLALKAGGGGEGEGGHAGHHHHHH